MNNPFNYIVFALGLMAAGFSVWKELRRQSRKNLAWRLIASIVAVSALVELIIPIQVHHPSGTSNGRQGIILTDGYSEDSVRNFMAEVSSSRSVIDAANFGNLKDSNFQNIHVFGFGLSEDELKPLKGLPLRFHPNPVPAGIQTADWDRKLTLGKSFRIQGQFRNEGSRRVSLVLTGTGNRLDSVEIDGNSSAEFSLSAIPRQLGRAEYQLIATSGKDTIEKELLPFETLPARNLNVLILASSPGFENKFLSQWLARQGYGVAMRSQISSHKFENTFLNLKPVPLSSINSAFLNSIDLVISDPVALSALTSVESSAIKSHVADGMGLVVHADSVGSKNAWYLSPFKLTPSSHLNSGSLQVRFENDNGKGYPIMADQAVFLEAEPATQVWAKDADNRIIVGSSLSGQGKKVLVTLSRTYPWILSGQENAYAGFWSQLVEKASRQVRSTESWNYNPAIPVMNDQVNVTRQGEFGKDASTIINDVRLGMAQDALLADQWKGKYWPSRVGWQASLPGQGEINWWWAFDQKEWLPLRRNLKLNATHEFILNNQVMSEPVIRTTAKTPLSRIFSFLIILICCAFLWIESKLNGERN